MVLLLEEERRVRKLGLMASVTCYQSSTLSFSKGLPLRAVLKDVVVNNFHSLLRNKEDSNIKLSLGVLSGLPSDSYLKRVHTPWVVLRSIIIYR
jgi:hypothetical protein